jgi:hypothetical protein
MIGFGIGVAVGAAATWAILHFAIVRRITTELHYTYSRLEGVGASVVRKF